MVNIWVNKTKTVTVMFIMFNTCTYNIEHICSTNQVGKGSIKGYVIYIPIGGVEIDSK